MNIPSEIENTASVFNSRYNKRTYVIYITLLMATIVAFASLPFIYVDITSQSRGIVRSIGDDVLIAPIVTGRIEYVDIFNNRQVHAGDTILKIDCTSIDAQLNAQNELVRDILERQNDLLSLTSGASNTVKLESAIYKQEFIDYKERMKDAEQKLAQYIREYNKANKGFIDGVVSKSKKEQAHDLMETARQNKATLKAQQLSAWSNTIVQLEEQLNSILADIKRLETEKENHTIIAPIDGTIMTGKQLSINSYVYSGQNIATISPDENLIVECYVLPTDIGFVHIGQFVGLQFDAFNYNQWGLGQAEVYDIDRNLTIQENNSYFVVRCKITKPTLSLKNGYSVNVKKGMTFTGRFFITERSLWQLLFDKIDDWFNPMQNKTI